MFPFNNKIKHIHSFHGIFRDTFNKCEKITRARSTIAMTISLVFAMNNLIYNDDLQARADSFASLTAFSIDIAHSDFDVSALKESLSYEEARDNYFIKRSDFDIIEYERIASLAFSAILIVGAMYISFVFVLLAMAILALKTLSNITDDAKNYQILHRLIYWHKGQWFRCRRNLLRIN